MNKKNKNKNRSKPTNPAPSAQKIETTQLIEEAISAPVDEKPVSLIKESDSVIESTSEATEPVEPNNVIPVDTPKKPKRNKGKKKKQEDTSVDENKPICIQDSASIPLPVSDSEIKDENTENTKETKVEEDDKNVQKIGTINVRKKKNKKTPNEDQKMEETSHGIDFAEKIDDNFKKDESVIDETTISNINLPEGTDSDFKQSKKKNKKKKHRRDSEKSDKADEVVICTAAFQKLISSTDREADIHPEKDIELSKDINEADKTVSTSEKEETLKELIESVLLSEDSKQLEEDGIHHDRINESKSKKKAKKEKKQQQLNKDTELSQTEQQITKPDPSVVSKIIVQELSLNDSVECGLKDVPKAKTKIEKPVDKKQKAKTESLEGCENKLEEAISDAFDTKQPLLEIEKLTENICGTDTSCDMNVRKSDETMKSELPEALILTEITNPSIETPFEICNLNLVDANMSIKSSEGITEPSVITPGSINFKSDKESDNILSGPLFTLETLVGEENLLDTTNSTKTDKTVEKKKKKHLKKIGVSDEKPENKSLTIPEAESIKVETPQKEDVFSGVPLLGDVEICSLKADELDSSSDVTPDFINHPMATSQQLTDDNNNMLIREISSTDEKLNLHLLIPTEPIIQDSGETPEPVVEKSSILSSSLTLVKEKSPTAESEKTDLKSKMMEVSQDMEELRLSIERSLAELTSMERSEQDAVKESIETEKSKLATTIEQKPCEIKENTSEKTESLSENVVTETVLQETHTTLNVSTENVEPDTQIYDSMSKIENIQEKDMDILSRAEFDKHIDVKETTPQAPVRRDHKGKGKGKKKGKQESQSQQTTTSITTVTTSDNATKEVKKEEKGQPEQKSQSSGSNEHKGKQQQQQQQLTMQPENDNNGLEQTSNDPTSNIVGLSFEPIEHFEDALTSSVDDVNKTFEIIANEVNNTPELIIQNPQINITSATEAPGATEPKLNPVSPPKNLLGHPDIPVPSNRTDYKKEKNKAPNMRQAKVKIKDAVDVDKREKTKQSKESQTENKRKIANNKNVLESFSYMTNEDAEYVYKYSFRKVFLQSLCHVCRKELSQRVPCQFCSLVFYCSQKHKDEDWPQHQSLCFAICTIAHLKDQKHIYADAKNVTGQSYRLLRMQMIVSCEKVLKRKLVPWEQEALLYPRICADVACREWKQSKLADCDGCKQISYCSEHPDHVPAMHQRWCRSYALYQKLVHHQQTRGRLEPKLPTRIVPAGYRVPEKINEVLAAMYDEKIDMTDTEYAALTQLATAPFTTVYCNQIAAANFSNGISKKTTFVVHIVGAELQFEADVLFKWEVFFLHLKPDVKELRVVLVSPDLNPSNLPLNLLEKVNLCESCKAEKRCVLFSFQDKKTYYEYWASDEFFPPDIVCAFNPSIQRSSMYNGKDTWPTAVSCILKLRTPLIVSSYSIDELNRDVARIKECSETSGVGFKTISEPKYNPFASLRPDRNFITDDEVPLLFKNYCFAILCGV